VFGVDGSETGAKALAVALELAAVLGAAVHVVSAYGALQAPCAPHSPFRGQLDHQLDHPGVILTRRVADTCEQPERRPIVALDQRDKPAHALPPRAIGQAVKQRVAQAAALPIVSNRDRDLGGLGSSFERM
jgi:nucleotide-binding universal stress UspA family protein